MAISSAIGWLSCLVVLWSVVDRDVVLGCNEAVCASIVSKCMLTQSCKCDDFKSNRTCSRDCYHCLDYLYHDCCSCVEMCPKPNNNESSLASKSHVEDLLEPQNDLFNVLTEEKDHLLRWTSYTFSMKLVIMESIGSLHKDVTKTNGSDDIDVEKDTPVNCTVAYMSQCMSWNKCKSSCTSMGATSYRWFHDGCCECVGYYCVNYGQNESKCLQCPLVAELDNSMEEHDTHGSNEEHSEDDAEDSEEDFGSQNRLNEKSEKNLKDIDIKKAIPESKDTKESV